MKLGLLIANYTLPAGSVSLGPELTALVGDVERAGFDSLWVMDHFFQVEHIGTADMDMLESYTTLAFLAALTRTLKLGALVTSCTYRSPELLCQAMVTLDRLSGGRAYLGIGAGWFEREHLGLGIPFPSVWDRFELLEACLGAILKCWSGRPHPPLLIGGMGEKKTLPLVARYAQACNLYQSAGVLVLGHKLRLLREYCERLGRDYAQIEKTTLGVFYPHPRRRVQEFLEELHALAELGVDSAIVVLPVTTDRVGLEILATEVLPQAALF